VQHGVDMGVVAVLAASLAAWNVVSERLERWNITGPMALVTLGYVVVSQPVSLVDVGVGTAGIRDLAELVLAVVLFSDAARVDLRKLERDALVPSRLLVVGLPLTIAMGTLACHLVIPGLSWAECALVGAAVAPTDAALGAAIIEDRRVPARLRRALNVESGLNDGIATPFVNLFLVMAAAGTALNQGSTPHFFAELAVGTACGVVLGVGGGFVMVRARAAGLSNVSAQSVAVAALAVLAYAGTVQINGNGFVAAFVAGLAYGGAGGRGAELLSFTADAAALGSQTVWFLFGAALLPAMDSVTWEEVLFAVLALTVLRMVPVAVSLVGSGIDRVSVLVIGWFGPRGLASVVFGLLAYDELGPDIGHRVASVIGVTVVASVVAHGVSAGPVASRLARREAGRAP